MFKIHWLKNFRNYPVVTDLDQSVLGQRGEQEVDLNAGLCVCVFVCRVQSARQFQALQAQHLALHPQQPEALLAQPPHLSQPGAAMDPQEPAAPAKGTFSSVAHVLC